MNIIDQRRLIDQLMKNEKPFGLMSEEMQEKSEEVGRRNFQCYMRHGVWLAGGDQKEFGAGCAYRLRPDYEEKPEIVECKIYPARDGDFYIDVYDFGGEEKNGLNAIPWGYKRTGFKFMDGSVFGSPVKYSVPGITSKGYYAHYDDLKTKQALEHHATHVLFRKGE